MLVVIIYNKLEISSKENFNARIQMLYNKRKRSLDKLKQIRLDEEKSEQSKCTFKPSITNYQPDTSVVLFI